MTPLYRDRTVGGEPVLEFGDIAAFEGQELLGVACIQQAVPEREVEEFLRPPRDAVCGFLFHLPDIIAKCNRAVRKEDVNSSSYRLDGKLLVSLAGRRLHAFDVCRLYVHRRTIVAQHATIYAFDLDI